MIDDTTYLKHKTILAIGHDHIEKLEAIDQELAFIVVKYIHDIDFRQFENPYDYSNYMTNYGPYEDTLSKLYDTYDGAPFRRDFRNEMVEYFRGYARILIHRFWNSNRIKYCQEDNIGEEEEELESLDSDENDDYEEDEE